MNLCYILYHAPYVIALWARDVNVAPAFPNISLQIRGEWDSKMLRFLTLTSHTMSSDQLNQKVILMVETMHTLSVVITYWFETLNFSFEMHHNLI